ncbi:MAG TPA: nitronate monooxygenase [Magnetospirillaceae bacterium]|jgi:nitronate monooxygenase
MVINPLLQRLGMEHPIIQGPMAGSGSSPELTAAVSNAGGLGSLGVSYMTPEQIVEEIRKTRALTSRPFAVNLFAGAWQTENKGDPAPMLDVMTHIHNELGLPALEAPTVPADPYPAQFEAVLKEKPAAFSFTFGLPHADDLARLRQAGIVTMGTATTIREGILLKEAGVDAVIAQGVEAGGHRGTFAGAFDVSMVPTMHLVTELHRGPPVLAAGGLMDGVDINVALAAGATAGVLGTAFLVTPESGSYEAHKQAVLAARSDTTVITRAFSGRPARGLYNTFIANLDSRAARILPYPYQNALTRPMRNAAGKKGLSQYLSLWAGKGVARARAMPAAELMRALVAEMQR